MDYATKENGTRTNAEQSETAAEFRDSYESRRHVNPGRDLYFIRVKDGPVKIGRSNNAKRRLYALQIASPYALEIVGILDDGGVHEGTFHSGLADHRIRGEWFTWSAPVEAAIMAALTDGRWRTAMGLEEFVGVDWRAGSPLYATTEVNV